MADERFRAAYEAAIEQVDALLSQVAKKKRFANAIAEEAGLPAPYGDAEHSASASAAQLRPDSFAGYGGKPSHATRKFLEMRGKAVGAASFDQIFDALARGGYPFTKSKSDQIASLRVALGKDLEIRRMPDGEHYGLEGWYGGRRVKKADATEGEPVADDEAEPEAEAPQSTEKELPNPPA